MTYHSRILDLTIGYSCMKIVFTFIKKIYAIMKLLKNMLTSTLILSLHIVKVA